MSFKKYAIEKIASYIPGYAGYKEKEVRRETDALLRRHIASILSSAAAQLARSPTDASVVAQQGVQCSQYSSVNPPEAKFCMNCGAKLE